MSSAIQPSVKPVIVGPGDDAGVYLLSDNQAIVETVDVITPVVNDPFTFGAISAANSLSDIYAMGGKPKTALAIVGFSSCDFGTDVIAEILKGAVDMLNKAGVSLLGGHSFEDPEIRFGLSVTGTIDKDKILRQKGSVPGDIIILTKPLGIGVLTTSLKGRKLEDKDMETAVKWMLTLNDKASEAALLAVASSATDVTGFGLLGHAHNMVEGTETDFIINNKTIPVLDTTRDMIGAGMVPEGTYNNLHFLDGKIKYHAVVSEEDKLLLADPQTSGGLLITLKEDRLNIFQKIGVQFSVIGRVEKGNGQIKVL